MVNSNDANSDDNKNSTNNNEFHDNENNNDFTLWSIFVKLETSRV